MEEKNQLSVEKIEGWLMEAFPEGPFMAIYGVWSTGESKVDVFANEIRKLVRLAGYRDAALERTVKLSFITGFPDHVSVDLQKLKFRPILDFRALNDHVLCHTGGEATDVCSETLREWSQMTGASTIVGLKSAYPQMHVAKRLWR